MGYTTLLLIPSIICRPGLKDNERLNSPRLGLKDNASAFAIKEWLNNRVGRLGLKAT